MRGVNDEQPFGISHAHAAVPDSTQQPSTNLSARV